MTPDTRHRVLVAVADLEDAARRRQLRDVLLRARVDAYAAAQALAGLVRDGLVTMVQPHGAPSDLDAEWTVTAEGWRMAREASA